MNDEDVKKSYTYKKLEDKCSVVSEYLKEADNSIYILENKLTKTKNDNETIVKNLQSKNDKLSNIVKDLD